MKIKSNFIIYLIIVMLPFSPMLKDIFSLRGPFVEPSYILSFIYFCYMTFVVRNVKRNFDKVVVNFFLFTLILLSLSLFGAFLSSLNANFTPFSLYDTLVQPIKLIFSFLLFYVIYSSLINNVLSNQTVIYALITSLIVQLLFSVFMFLNWLGYFNLISSEFFLQNSFDDRFSLPVGGVIFPRFFGTAAEPAPYGFFGLICFCYAYFFCEKDKDNIPVFILKVLSLLVVITSLSDQVFLAFFPILIHYFFIKRKCGFISSLIFIFVFIASIFAAIHIFDSIIYKLSVSSGSGSLGSSSGERFFHLSTILNRSENDYFSLLFGNGSGLYGFYLNGVFSSWPTTTTPSILIGDFIFSYGFFGLILSMLFFLVIFFRTPFLCSAVLIGNLFQYDWKLSSFFFILAVIAFHFFSIRGRL